MKKLFVDRIVRSALLAGGLMLVLAATAGRAYARLPGPPGAPEIDPGSAASALALLAGGLLVLTSRRKSS